MNVGNAVAWGPMAPERPRDVLRMAAEVAAADSGHDLLTALDVLNKDRLHPAGRPQLHEADLRQVARVLLAGIAVDGQIASLGGEVAAVNAWLVQHGRVQGRLGGPENVMAGLFRSAAEQIEAGRRGEPTVGA